MGLLRAFLSYRSSDTGALAAQIASRLKADLGLDAVYYAPTDNRLFDDWAAKILGHLDESQVLVALLGERWRGTCAHDDDEHDDCILDDADWVRREVAYGLSDPDTVVLPVLVGINRIPDSGIPDDFAPLATTQGVTLDSAELDEAAYQGILTGCWLSLERLDQDTMVVVSDGSAEAKVYLDRLVAALNAEGLIDLPRLSATINAPDGLQAFPLREGAERWPDIIAIIPNSESAMALARLKAVSQVRGVRAATLVTGSVAAGSMGLPALIRDLGIDVAESTIDQLVSAVGSAPANWAPPTGGAPSAPETPSTAASVQESGLSVGAKIALTLGALGLAVAAVVGVVLATADSDARAGDCIYVTWMGAVFQNLDYSDYAEDGNECIEGVGIFDADCSVACFVTPSTCDAWFEEWAANYVDRGIGDDPVAAAANLDGQICGRPAIDFAS